MSISVSVVIPVYNGEAFLNDAITSILRQTRQVDEIIVVDDGSRDSSYAISLAISKTSPVPIKVFKQCNSGVSAARNLGLQKSSGDLVAFLDVDDIWTSEKIEKQLLYYEKCEKYDAFLFSDYYLDNEIESCRAFSGYSDISVCTVNNFSKENFQLSFLRRNFVGTASTIIFNREVALKIGGFNVRLNHSEDFDFILRYSQHGAILAVNEPLVIKQSHGNNLSGDLKLHFWSHCAALRNNIELSSCYTRFNYTPNVLNEMKLSHDIYIIRYCNEIYESSKTKGLMEYFMSVVKLKSLSGGLMFLKAFTRKLIRTLSFNKIKR
ncbi:glycosyltransferase family 2 protein [Alteromonas mediterranea]|uniref:glycosyltransferase family 2 protein n=1 Tax=Alteromonas mediterranea TaxID=314275 RepID=UPI000ADA619C|nr:glycosyltransferase family A protein [Alteromonas mediterranea]